jgi:hypothetical protein
MLTIEFRRTLLGERNIQVLARPPIHSDASYLSETRARSRVAGHFFLGLTTTDNQPIELNGAIYTLCGILKIVVASAAEAELA